MKKMNVSPKCEADVAPAPRAALTGADPAAVARQQRPYLPSDASAMSLSYLAQVSAEVYGGEVSSLVVFKMRHATRSDDGKFDDPADAAYNKHNVCCSEIQKNPLLAMEREVQRAIG